MPYYLPSNSQPDSEPSSETPAGGAVAPVDMADLRVFWGPEICRLEYLVHLLDTGRIVDERRARRA